MRILFFLALFGATQISQAAILEFGRAEARTAKGDNEAAWAIDLAVARQWYIAWASSTERLYHRVVGPKPIGIQRSPQTKMIDVVFLSGISLLFVAALRLASQSLINVIGMRRQRVTA